MHTALFMAEILICVGLIASVLLQSGKDAGFNGALTGSSDQMVGNRSRGKDMLLKRMTAVLGGAFILVAILITALRV